MKIFRNRIFLFFQNIDELEENMKLIEIILISIALAMDAFAVSICKGLSMHKMNWKKAITIGLYFGGFQAMMPMLGFFLGSKFETVVTSIDHWIAFILLSIIGGNMIKESFETSDENCNDDMRFKTMVMLAIATSIDALAVGITFAFLKVNVVLSVSFIGVITFGLSVLGVKIGNRFGSKYENKAELVGRMYFGHHGNENFVGAFKDFINEKISICLSFSA